MRGYWKLAMVLPSAAWLLGGCGSGSERTEANGVVVEESDSGSAGAPVAAIDPCSLITPAEMTAITSDAVTGTRRDGAECQYDSRPNDGVRITVMTSGGKKQMEVVRRTASVLSGMGASVADKGNAGKDAEALLKKDGTAVPQIGDEAAWGAVSMLSVRKGDAYVEVVPPMMHDPANHSGYPIVSSDEKRKIAIAIATRLIAKLP